MKKTNLSWVGALLVFALLLWCTAATPGKIADPSTYTCAVYSSALSLLPPVVAIVLALVLCGILTTITTGIDPIEVYKSIFTGAFGTERKTWITLQNLSILLLIALALTPAFKMKFWNIGAEGQILVGGIATAACMIYLKALPPVVLNMLLVGAMLAYEEAGASAAFGSVFLFNAATVGIGEAIACYGLGMLLLWQLPRIPYFRDHGCR